MSDSESEVTSQLLGRESDNSGSALECTAGKSNNRIGKNQHEGCRKWQRFQNVVANTICLASIGDMNVRAALLEYHKRNITNKYTISELFQAEHGITLS
jgi:hypothetical protein